MLIIKINYLNVNRIIIINNELIKFLIKLKSFSYKPKSKHQKIEFSRE